MKKIELNIQLFAVSKSTSFSEPPLTEKNIKDNKSSLTIDIYFSPNNNATWFQSKTLYCTCNGVEKSQKVGLSKGGSVSASFTFDNIPHKADGSKNVDWNWIIYTGTSVLGDLGDSGTKQLQKISRASQLNNNGWDTTDQQDITGQVPFIINRYLENVYHKLVASITENNIETIIAERTDLDLIVGSNNYSFQFTAAELNNLYPYTKNSNNKLINIVLYTYSDVSMTTQIGTQSQSKWTGLITDANPIFNNFYFSDSNSKTSALTGDTSKIVQGYSNVKIDIPSSIKAIGQKSAVITNYNIYGNLVDYADNFTYTIEKFTAAELIAYAIDSRNNSTRVAKPVTLLNYSKPVKLSNSVTRENNTGTQSTFKFEGTFWNNSFGNTSNGLVASYKFQKTDTANPEEWIVGVTPINITTDGNNYSFEGILRGDASDNGFELEDAYNIIITVSDELDSVDFVYLLNAASPAEAIYKNNVSLGGDYDISRGGRLQLLGQFVVDLEYVGEYNEGS